MHKVLRKKPGLAALKLGEVWAYRELAVFLAWRDLLVRYKQTVIGVLWAVIRPLITVVIFSIIFGRLAKLPSGAVPYPVFALAGLLPWQLFSTALADAGGSVLANSQLISKVYFPRLIIPISATITALADSAISAAMLGLLMVWYRIPARIETLWILPLTLLCVIAALGVGIWSAALLVRYRDVRHVLPFALQLGLYVSPVAFASTLVPQRWRLAYALNPMVGVIDGFRWALFGGPNHVDVSSITAATILSIAILISGLFYFRKTERIFADII